MSDNTQNNMPAMNRRNKRAMYKQYGLLKEKKNWSIFSEKAIEWRERMREEGAAAHEANEKRMNDELESQLQVKLDSSKENWKKMGYNEEEIKKLEEAWTIGAFKFKDTYREDKKKARKLTKEANESLRKRLDAGNNS